MNVHSFDLNLLVAFECLLVERSVTRAAVRLGVTQPAVSNALSRLRLLCNDPLFVRIGAAMEPTPHALSLASPVRQALELLNTAVERLTVFNPSSSTRQFNLLMPDLAVALILPRLMARLAVDAPGVTIRAVQAPLEERAHVLQAGLADIAMWGDTSLFKNRFYRQRLWRHNYVCLARMGHPMLKLGLDKSAFAACKHVLVQSGTRTNAALAKALQRDGLKRSVALEIPSYLGLTEILKNTDLLAIVSATVATMIVTPSIAVHPIPFHLPSTAVYLFWHERYHQDAGHVWLRRMLHGLFREHSASASHPLFSV